LNGAFTNNLSSINTSSTNGMYNSSLSTGTYSWLINCTDVFGNVGNSSARVLYIYTLPAESTSSTSTSSAAVKINLGEDYLGEINQINYGYRYYFDSHYFYLRKINKEEGTALLEIHSDIINLNLTQGEFVNVDLDFDGVLDLSFKLHEILEDKVSIKLEINNVLAEERVESFDEGVLNNKSSQDFVDETAEEGSSSWWIWVLIVFVIVVLLIIGYYFWNKK
jgi:hypothetical protein